MKSVSELQPEKLWSFFAKICAIPHPSYHEQALADWIANLAVTHGLVVKRDPIGNVMIRKAATPGRESQKGVIIQAHLDMVPQKCSDNPHDFITDPIIPTVDGDWVRAKGTTLGADNGIGLAAALAIMASDDILHGPLEFLFTINEESGMEGAFNLGSNLLNGDILLNTDSEQIGEVFIGCAGGGDTKATFDIDFVTSTPADIGFNVMISGLKGGHSGCDIALGRANANVLIGRLLSELDSAGISFSIARLQGGALRNAIPRDAEAMLMIAPELQTEVEQILQTVKQQFITEFADVEPELQLCWSVDAQHADQVFSRSFQQRIIRALVAAPNGVIKMSDEFNDVVQTSLNFGMICQKNGRLELHFLVRSLMDKERLAQETVIKRLLTAFGADVISENDYPGWAPRYDAAITALVSEVYEQLFLQKPKPMVIHAGLECGLFKRTYPNWEMVSIGPTIKFPHSPDEKVEIRSVAMFWQWLVAILAAIPPKNGN